MKNNIDNSITIKPEDSGERADVILGRLDVIASRSQAKKLFERNLVFCNGTNIKASYQVEEGDEIEFSIPTTSDNKLEPYDFPLDILFEDEDLIVLNKPAGLVVHPAAGHANDTLVNALIHHTNELSMGFEEKRPGIVHRIDKDTSGLIVVAKNNSAHENLAQQFQKKSTHRVYWAICYDKPRQPQGTIESLISRDPKDRKRFSSNQSEGKRAVTHYLFRDSNKGLSWLELKLETGRTHQIRVHLKELLTPIIGDLTYGKASRSKSLESVQLRKKIDDLGRFALVAVELGFNHPNSGDNMFFKVGWPSDLMEIVEICGFQE